MTGLDTNVLVRYLTQDDPAQARKATHTIEAASRGGDSLFVANIVMCELVWVLEDAYSHTRTDIADALEQLLRIGEFLFEDKDMLWQALADYQHGKGDFSDHLVGRVGHRAGCDYTATFDRDLKNNRLFRIL